MTDWKEDIFNWLDFYSSCEMLEAQGLEKKLIKIVEEVEDKARAEERRRIVEIVERMKKPLLHDVNWAEGYNQGLNTLMKSLTKKE